MHYRWYLLLGLLVTGTAFASNSAIILKNAWVRAMPPGSHMTAAYFTLINKGNAPVTLIGAKTPVAKSASLHRSMHHKGMDHMVPVSSLQVAPHDQVIFSPGGLHIMLKGVKDHLKSKKKVVLCLILKNSQVCEKVPVKK